jgi:hypothetical protein
VCGFILSLSAPVYTLKRHLVRVNQNFQSVIHKYRGIPLYLTGTIQSFYKQKKIILNNTGDKEAENQGERQGGPFCPLIYILMKSMTNTCTNSRD